MKKLLFLAACLPMLAGAEEVKDTTFVVNGKWSACLWDRPSCRRKICSIWISHRALPPCGWVCRASLAR